MTKRITVLILLSISLMSYAGDWWPVAMHRPDSTRDTLSYGIELSAVAGYGEKAPFWLHANEQGNISDAPFSGNVTASFFKRATCPSRWYDYDFGISLTGRFDTYRTTGYFRQLYAHARLYIVDITAGIKPFHAGSQNRALSMGGFLFSGNAQPLPRISIGFDEYIPFPGLFGYLEVKGGLTHGWFVDASRIDTTIGTTDALLHHKFVGFRAGGSLPINISYEFHHAAQWGGKSPVYGQLSSDWKTFRNIFFVRGGGVNLSDQLNAEGNHIGFQELALSAKWNQWRITAYWQTIFEDKSARFIGFSNQADGLWGLNIEQSQWPFIHSFTYEFLNTTEQDGPWHDRDGLTYGGRSNYFSNLSYKQGWTHFGRTIGSPFMRPDNNRVRVHYAGIAGDIYGYKYRAMVSYARNWGSYQKPVKSDNTALMIELHKRVEQAWGLDFGVRVAADIGSQYGNQFGVMLTIHKEGLIYTY